MTMRSIVFNFAFVEFVFDEAVGEAGGVHGGGEVAEDVGERADVVFVAVGDEVGAEFVAAFGDVGDVGDDEVDAMHLFGGEHDAGVDDDEVVGGFVDHGVAADFSEAAEGDDAEGVGGDVGQCRLLAGWGGRGGRGRCGAR